MANPALVLKLALREMRGGFAGLRLFMGVIAIGVAAIVAVGATTQSLQYSFAAEGRAILGGDVSFTRGARPLEAPERAALAARGRVSEIATMRAMARKADEKTEEKDAKTEPKKSGADEANAPTLIEIKAVDDAYPLVGAVRMEPAQTLRQALELRDGAYGALADASLLNRLGLQAGDRLAIGAQNFRVGVLKSEPDRIALGVGFGPHVMMSREGLAATGLVQPTTLVRYSARLTLADGASDAQTARAAKEITEAFPQSGWDVRERSNASPQLTRNIARFAQFMSLIGLVSLVVGGVGVAGAVTAFVARKRETIAIYKSLGASGARIFALVLTQMAIVATLGALMGAAFGLTAPYIVARFVADADFPFTPMFAPGAAFAGLGLGALTALCFAIVPSGRAHDLSATQLFRPASPDERRSLRARYLFGAAGAGALLVGALYLLSADRFLALVILGAVGACAVVLRLVATAIALAARHAPRRGGFVKRIALANLHRPGSPIVALTAALGLGLTLVVVIVGVEKNIQAQLQSGQGGRTPDYFFLDVPSSQGAAFRDFLKEQRPQAMVEEAPMMRGRIMRVGDVSAEEIRKNADAGNTAAWTLEGDRGVTFAATPPRGSQIVAGEWWPADYKGPPLLSIDADIAKGLGLKIGDKLTVNVAGRNIEAKIVNLRQIDWRSFGINFVLVFTPATFAGAPHATLFTLSSHQGAAEHDGALMRALARRFPGVTSIGVREALEAAMKTVDQLSSAARWMASIALATAGLVLAGAVAAGQRARQYDSSILRALGARRSVIFAIHGLEFGAAGLAAALFATAAGSIIAALVVSRMMKLDYLPDWPMAALVAFGGGALALVVGLAAAWRAVETSPTRVLRDL